jgi:hypothetical protein
MSAWGRPSRSATRALWLGDRAGDGGEQADAQVGGRSHGRRIEGEQVHGLANGGEGVAALAAVAEVRVCVCPEGQIEEEVVVEVIHGRSLQPADSAARSFLSPAPRRDLTVPMGIFRASAISLADRPAK